MDVLKEILTTQQFNAEFIVNFLIKFAFKKGMLSNIEKQPPPNNVVLSKQDSMDVIAALDESVNNYLNTDARTHSVIHDSTNKSDCSVNLINECELENSILPNTSQEANSIIDPDVFFLPSMHTLHYKNSSSCNLKN